MKKPCTAVFLLPLLAGMCLLARSGAVRGEDFFDPGLLKLGGAQLSTTDLSVFAQPGGISPGSYLVTLVVNQNEQGQYAVEFSPNAQGEIRPELTPAMLYALGINTRALPGFANLPVDQPIDSLAALILDAKVNFDLPELRLELSVPQIAMQSQARGAINPALWDNGVPAFLLNYTLNGGRNWQEGQDGFGKSTQTNLFGNLRSGLNYGPWRLRSTLTYTRNSSNGETIPEQSNQQTQFTDTYLQRDITPWRASVLVGENSSSADVLDSVPFRGVKLSSNEEMLPYSLRGFAPLISGIAQTNARITVSQNGNIVYQTFVPPGPFRITDLYQTSQSSDLIVTIYEADGRVRTQNVTVSSLPVMRRPGSLKYEIIAGRYHGGVTVKSREADFVSATAIYGLPGEITLYGGTLLANDYSALVAGSGISLGAWGALSADVTHARATFQTQEARQQGRAYRLRYAKNLQETGTTIDVTASRHDSRHYYSFTDFNSLGFRLNADQMPWTLERQRNSLQLQVNQQLGRYGSLYLSGTRSDYWNSDRTITSLSAGYNGSYRGISFGVAYSIDRIKQQNDWPENRQLSLNIQVPLNLFVSSAPRNSYARYQMTHNNHGQVQHQAGLNGNALDDRLSYSMTQSWSNTSTTRSISNLNTSYQGSQGMVNLGYSYSNTNRSLNLGGNGALVVHPEGITFGRMLGNSVAVVSAPGASGAGVLRGNIRTDSRGYALVPYLSNYQRNHIDLDPSTLPDNVDLTQSSVNVYPTQGAVVMAHFDPHIGYQVLFTLLHANNPVPFGTFAVLEGGSREPTTGIVGDDGQLYLSGLPEKGRLLLSWGHETEQQCTVTYNLNALPAPQDNSPVRFLTTRCE